MSVSSKQAGRKATPKGGSRGKGKSTAVASAENLPKQTATEAPRSSIRNLIRSMITGGSSTAEITSAVQEKFPTSMAAQKAGKHISFYRSQLKKEATKAVA